MQRLSDIQRALQPQPHHSQIRRPRYDPDPQPQPILATGPTAHRLTEQARVEEQRASIESRFHSGWRRHETDPATVVRPPQPKLFKPKRRFGANSAHATVASLAQYAAAARTDRRAAQPLATTPRSQPTATPAPKEGPLRSPLQQQLPDRTPWRRFGADNGAGTLLSGDGSPLDLPLDLLQEMSEMRVSADGLPIDAGRALQVGDAARAAGSGRAKAQIRVGPVAARQMTQLVAMLWNASSRLSAVHGALGERVAGIRGAAEATALSSLWLPGGGNAGVLWPCVSRSSAQRRGAGNGHAEGDALARLWRELPHATSMVLPDGTVIGGSAPRGRGGTSSALDAELERLTGLEGIAAPDADAMAAACIDPSRLLDHLNSSMPASARPLLGEAAAAAVADGASSPLLSLVAFDGDGRGGGGGSGDALALMAMPLQPGASSGNSKALRAVTARGSLQLWWWWWGPWWWWWRWWYWYWYRWSPPQHTPEFLRPGRHELPDRILVDEPLTVCMYTQSWWMFPTVVKVEAIDGNEPECAFSYYSWHHHFTCHFGRRCSPYPSCCRTYKWFWWWQRQTCFAIKCKTPGTTRLKVSQAWAWYSNRVRDAISKNISVARRGQIALQRFACDGTGACDTSNALPLVYEAQRMSMFANYPSCCAAVPALEAPDSNAGSAVEDSGGINADSAMASDAEDAAAADGYLGPGHSSTGVASSPGCSSTTAGRSAAELAAEMPPWCMRIALTVASAGPTVIELSGSSTTGSIVCTPASRGLDVDISQCSAEDAAADALMPSAQAPQFDTPPLLLTIADGATTSELVLCRCKSDTHGICALARLDAKQMSGANLYDASKWADDDDEQHFAPAMPHTGCCTGPGVKGGVLRTDAHSHNQCEQICRMDGGCSAFSSASWPNNGITMFSCFLHSHVDGDANPVVKGGGGCPVDTRVFAAPPADKAMCSRKPMDTIRRVRH